MIISQIKDGIGNQLFRYAAGLRLAHKLGTEFKIDISDYITRKFRSYVLDQFNITADFADSAEIQRLKKLHEGTDWGKEHLPWQFMPEVLDWRDDVYLKGSWEDERYFADIADIIRREFTFKNKLGAAARRWRKKISDAKCSVSIHVRHGDFVFIPSALKETSGFAILPLEYYYECIRRLKRQYKNLTVFVFSDDLDWCRDNLHFDVPTEFVAGDGLTDVEEFRLMSLCKHNVIANSTFSWWAAWLNQNPDKKVFMPIPDDAEAQKAYRYSPQTVTNSPLESDKWTRVFFDLNKRPALTKHRYFSLLLVVNNDVLFIRETLNSILAQNYEHYELIIVDNASTDKSREFCRQAAAAYENVTLIKLYDKVSDGAAWNKALEVAQGDYVIFLRGSDRISPDALNLIYLTNSDLLKNIIYFFTWLREDKNGSITLGDKKFIVEGDPSCNSFKSNVSGQLNKPVFLDVLANSYDAIPIGTKVFKREFLTDNAIKFNEHIGNEDAQILFTINAFFLTDEVLFMPKLFFIAPRKNVVDLEELYDNR